VLVVPQENISTGGCAEFAPWVAIFALSPVLEKLVGEEAAFYTMETSPL
jgi:hypothetical protein